jgi:hypothetical protein
MQLLSERNFVIAIMMVGVPPTRRSYLLLVILASLSKEVSSLCKSISSSDVTGPMELKLA